MTYIAPENSNFDKVVLGVFREIVIPPAVVGSQTTGINDLEQVCGFHIDRSGLNHGFLLVPGGFKVLNFPGVPFTQALGLNSNNSVVGFYMNRGGASHGFVYDIVTKKFQSIDEPNGIGTTVVNGINDSGQIVGFYVDSSGNTDGFVGTPIS